MRPRVTTDNCNEGETLPHGRYCTTKKLDEDARLVRFLTAISQFKALSCTPPDLAYVSVGME